ncbi:MAG: hypothetical protein HY741_22995 [Chloroflexi bacterium]|nr:hypothetical protein [Chloroflexota bacterium]
MKHLSHFRWFALLAILLGLALLLAPQWAKPVKAATVTIDAFSTNTGIVTADSTTNPNEASTSDGSVAGTYRTIYVSRNSSDGSLAADSNRNVTGWFSSSLTSTASGTTILQYDGNSAYSSTPGTFSSVLDLTGGGTNAGIDIGITYNDKSTVPVIVRYYSTSSSVRYCSELSVTPPMWTSGGIWHAFYAFASFTTCSGYPGTATASSVDAIEVVVDSSGVAATDMSFDFVEARDTPTALDLASFGGKAQGSQVVLKWETASELNTLGFNVWRKQGKAGWRQLNAETIAAKNPGNVSGNKYSYADANTKAGKTYKYKLQVLSADGSSSWTKVVKVKVSK